MGKPLILAGGRNLNWRHMVGEALWIVEGKSDVESLFHYGQMNAYRQFSDDGYHYQGAYGPQFVSQLNYICDTLKQDKDTRQAVINIWRKNPRPSKDIPCTLSVQFIVVGRSVHTVVTMRSSDLWLGLPYDLFAFTMMTVKVIQRYNKDIPATYHQDQLELGMLYLNVGNQHLYMRDLEALDKVSRVPDGYSRPMLTVPSRPIEMVLRETIFGDLQPSEEFFAMLYNMIHHKRLLP